MDNWGTYKTPCPYCKGEVSYWNFEPDCRGNKGSSGIQCQNCNRKFTKEDWRNIEKEKK